MKKIVINGAGCMLGLNLIEYALRECVEITAIIRENSSKLKFLPKSDLVKVVECNLENIKDLKIDKDCYDAFYHFAWSAALYFIRRYFSVFPADIHLCSALCAQSSDLAGLPVRRQRGKEPYRFSVALQKHFRYARRRAEIAVYLKRRVRAEHVRAASSA